MAFLKTTTSYPSRGNTILELKPNSPTQRELTDTYHLRLWIHDQLIFDRMTSVRDWQSRHYYVEQIAGACCSIDKFLDKSIENSLPNATNADKFWSQAHTSASTEWLTVYLAAATTKRFGTVVQVHLYLVQTEHQIGDAAKRSVGQWGEWQEQLSAMILCKPRDATEFGTQLLNEIREVEKQRIELGIPEFDDPSYETNDSM